jgi:ABC-2 type transport system ATP-binding protein
VVIIDHGEVVAAGTPAELEGGTGVEVELASGLQTFPGATRDDVPRIVADLVAAGEQVYGVRVVRSSLEDVYLETVTDAR